MIISSVRNNLRNLLEWLGISNAKNSVDWNLKSGAENKLTDGILNNEVSNILTLNAKESAAFLNSFDTVITDVDGVLCTSSPVPGSQEVIENLKAMGKKIYYLSNNTVKTYGMYEKQFPDIGLQLDPASLMHPGKAIIKYLKDKNFNKKAFCIVTVKMLELFRNAGIDCITTENSSQEDIKWFLKNVKDEPDVGAVIIDFDVNVNYLKICKAVSILKRPDVLYIVGTTEKIIPIGGGMKSLGPSPFIQIVSQMSRREPVQLAKPSQHLKEVVMKSCGISDPQRTIIIGDSLKNDMAFGSVCGFQKLLVLTGVTTLEDLQNSNKENQRPDFWVESFGHINSVIERAHLQC